MSRAKKYRSDLDMLKGIAIIAVILYHLGLLRSGYLGVDLFFVVNGFLVVPGVWRKIENNEFDYIRFLVERVMRLMPVLLIACVVCLVVGFYGMLPDDYENLGQSIVASLVYSNNLLQSITTRDYWNVVNEYKPLMQTWYLGILMEFYVILPMILGISFFVAKKNQEKGRQSAMILLLVCTIISFVLYLLPITTDGFKFYWLPFRFWELGMGGLIGLAYEKCCEVKILQSRKTYFGIVALLIGVLLLGSGCWGVILTVLLATILVEFGVQGAFEKENVLSYLGKRSYSLFLWHQVVLAFYRYYVSSNITVPFFVGYFAVIILLSHMTYLYVEKRIKITEKNVIITVVSTAVIGGVSLLLYLHAGVVRDIPELDIDKRNVHRNMHAEYVDRIYDYDVDFPEDNGKINVMLIGNSFARDFGNILLESEMAEQLNISYSFDFSEELCDRLDKCDILFCFASKNVVPTYVWDHVDDEKVWGIGTKTFGENNGQIYRKRFMENYFVQTIIPDEEFEQKNRQWREAWGENYIDMMEYARTEEGSIRVFSHENKFISQDCSHLTRGGARYYAQMIEWSDIF